MKRIEALVRPAALENIKEGLASAEVRGLTVSEARVFGCIQRRGVYRGSAHTLDFAPALKIEIVAPEAHVPRILEALAHSSAGGDSKVIVSSVVDAIRIRTNEHGEDAL